MGGEFSVRGVFRLKPIVVLFKPKREVFRKREVSREAAVAVAPPVFSSGRTVRDQWQSHRPPCPASKL